MKILAALIAATAAMLLLGNGIAKADCYTGMRQHGLSLRHYLQLRDRPLRGG